tara:strand:+ start:879 stop:1316 length:438 start_codon:yes stop_codon:yes gene_type:complete
MTTAPFQILPATWNDHSELLLKVRRTVFIEEQNVPAEIEIDEFDPISRHLIAISAPGEPIGTARLLPDGKIGRVAVLKEWRRQGVGRQLMSVLIETAQADGHQEIQLHAQLSSLAFYEDLGFAAIGPEFAEAGISHREMRLHLGH